MTIRQPFDLALSLETGQAFRWRRVREEEIRHQDLGDPPARWRRNGGAWYSGVLGESWCTSGRPARAWSTGSAGETENGTT